PNERGARLSARRGDDGRAGSVPERVGGLAGEAQRRLPAGVDDPVGGQLSGVRTEEHRVRDVDVAAVSRPHRRRRPRAGGVRQPERARDVVTGIPRLVWARTGGALLAAPKVVAGQDVQGALPAPDRESTRL